MVIHVSNRSAGIVGIGLVISFLVMGCGVPVSPPQTVAFVDLEKYLGLWYEIASYPTFFNQGLYGTRAEYTPNPDGTITVVNRAFQGSFDGPETMVTGVARVVETATNAKLAVRFSGFPQSFFVGDYWIIDLDADYQHAVVSDPAKTTLFILSRTPTVSSEFYGALIARLTEQGFDPARIQRTPQIAPSPTEE